MSTEIAREGTTAFALATAERIEREAEAWRVTTQGMADPPPATREQIPVLDMALLNDGRVAEFVDTLRTAAYSTGFFLLAGHGVPLELEEEIHRQTRRFHALAEEAKLQYSQDSNGVGYVPLNVRRQPRREKGNMCECVYFKREHGPRDITWDMNQWPDELGPGFRTTVITYLEALEGVGKRLLPAYELLLGLPGGFFAEAFDGGLIRSRLAHYPEVELEDNQFGVAPHVDTTFLTILSRREDTPGLRVCTLDDEWLTVPNLEGHFTVNSGELLKMWTNDRVSSTRHYANAVGSSRQSIPFFWHPRADYVMDCRDIPAPSGAPAGKYPPFSYLQSQGLAQGE